MQTNFNRTSTYYARKNPKQKSFKISAILLILTVILLGVSAPILSKTDDNYIAKTQNSQIFALEQKKWQT